MVRDAADLKAHGIGFVAVSSNDADAYPEDSFDNMARFSAVHRFGFPYLYDEDQSLARAYGAACTPDFFGFNRDLELQYRGRLDASRREVGPADMRRDLFEAMVEVAAHRPGAARPDRLNRLLDQMETGGMRIGWASQRKTTRFFLIRLENFADVNGNSDLIRSTRLTEIKTAARGAG